MNAESPTTDLQDTEKNVDDIPVWSIAGFEVFDLLVIVFQVFIYLVSLTSSSDSIGWMLSHPVSRFVLGTGFVVAIFMLHRTRIYARGVRQIESEHEYLWAVIYVGGSVLGIIILTVYLFGPIKVLLDFWELDTSWLSIPGVPLSIVALGFLPFLAMRAEKRDLNDPTQFKEYPAIFYYAGRAIILLLANSILHVMYHGVAEDNQTKQVINGVAVMLLFYIPVRMQEMFIRPDGPHFQSLFQTLLALAFGSLSILLF